MKRGFNRLKPLKIITDSNKNKLNKLRYMQASKIWVFHASPHRRKFRDYLYTPKIF